MNFVGDTISLRAAEPSDIQLIYQWENDATLWNCSSTISPYSKYHLQSYLETAGDIFSLRQIRLMIIQIETNIPVGCVDLFDFEPRFGRAEVAILIDKQFQSNGFASEALQILDYYAFNFLTIHQLYAYVGVDNLPSYQLFLSAGYQKITTLKDWYRDGDWKDCFLMQKIKP